MCLPIMPHLAAAVNRRREQLFILKLVERSEGDALNALEQM